MSKFLDRLERASRSTGPSLGFGAASRSEVIPALALVGKVSHAGSADAAALLARIGADAALLEGVAVGNSLDEVLAKLEDVPWGPRLDEAVDAEDGYRDKGCDFLAFGPERPVMGASDDNTGSLLAISPDLDERALRSIEGLPVDVVLLTLVPAGGSLTMGDLMSVGSVRVMFSKYLLLDLPHIPSTKELEALRDMGVDGLVVDTASTSAKDMESLKEGLRTLPRRKPKSPRHAATLPSAGFTRDTPPPPEEDDEEDF
jgi:hypothetical protein